MIINHNIPAMNTYRQLTINNSNTAKSLEKLSSGFRINRAGDDAAGLAISEKMRGQIRGLDMASKNAQDSISLIQTAEGALNETHSILQRMRELAVQASNDTNTDADRKEIAAEVKQLIKEIDRIGNTTEFNTKKLLEGSARGVADQLDGTVKINNNSKLTIKETVADSFKDVMATTADGAYMIIRTAGTTGGSYVPGDFKVIGPDGQPNTDLALTSDVLLTLAGNTFNITDGTLNDIAVGDSITLVVRGGVAASNELDESIMTQIGANAGQTMFISIRDMRAEAIGVANIDVSQKFGAQVAIETVNNAIEKVSSQRSLLGAMQNRLEHTITNLGTSSENLSAAESRIRDVDMAKEMMNFTKNSILQQAATAMLAQANQQPQGVLQLLR